MLERQLVCEIEHLLVVTANDDPPVVGPCDTGNVSGCECLKLPLDFGDRRKSQIARRGEKHCRRSGAMLGLSEQISRAHLGIDGVVGEQQCFSGAGRQIDPNAAEELPLCFRNEFVARPDEYVDGIDEFGSQRE